MNSPLVNGNKPVYEIHEKCTQLVNLNLRGIESCFPAKTIASLGSRLQVLTMTHAGEMFTVEEMTTILAACPNVKVDLGPYIENRPIVPLLGAHLRHLKCEFVRRDTLSNAVSTCTKIEELTVCPTDEHTVHTTQWFSSFFAYPKPLLRSLNFTTVLKVRWLKEYMDALAQTVSTIEVSLINSNFATSNKHLHAATVNCLGVAMNEELEEPDPTVESMETIAAIFADDFSQCNDLKELVLSHRSFDVRLDRVAEACVPLRSREADIFILGFQYASFLVQCSR